MKKVLLSFAFCLLLSIFMPLKALAYDNTFTASNYCLNDSILTFDASSYSGFNGTTLKRISVLDSAGQGENFAWFSDERSDPQSTTHFSYALAFLNHGTPPPNNDSTLYTIVIFENNDSWIASQDITGSALQACPTPTPIEIIASPASGTKTVGTPFNVDVKVTDEGDAFNAARATVSVSSNLEVTNVFPANSNACNLHYTTTPTTGNPSFAGAIFGDSATDCTVYRLVLTPTSAGTGTVTFTNGSIKSYEDNAEILTGVTNASFTINAAGATPTPTTGLSQLTITSPLQTYLTAFNLAGTKDSSITQVFVNDSDDDTTYPTGTTWSVPVTLNLGINNYTIYGRDAEANQTGAITTTVDRHILGDINGDGEIDLLDASLFAVDWDKTSDFSYILSDMNADGNVDLTDLSILAKLE